ncbi:hypothetical protein [uncultured Litoreibacter sp.]|uniref:hypothetical protein n=1 Tax=uncultured Litoreibacter sp. TaxID=1392394 RepID=UPI00260916B5|nr:hypothetical protein [uncultured Litoreibacter sp.]
MPSALNALLWALAALAAALYGALAYGSFVTMPSLAGGILGFDMRPFGMSGARGGIYLSAMTEAGRDYYVNWLKPVDTVFIGTLTTLLLLLAFKLRRWRGWLIAVSASAYAAFDLLENLLVSSLITHGAKSSTSDFVQTIAMFTTGKFLSLAIALIALKLAWRSAHAQR